MEDEETSKDYGSFAETISATTTVFITPEMEDNTAFWLYSTGMIDNWDLPDIEMRGVPSSFMKAAGNVINEMNVYRLHRASKGGPPMEIGETVSWDTGEFIIAQSETHEGEHPWKDEEMLRLSPRADFHIGCASCAANECGIEE